MFDIKSSVWQHSTAEFSIKEVLLVAFYTWVLGGFFGGMYPVVWTL